MDIDFVLLSLIFFIPIVIYAMWNLFLHIIIFGDYTSFNEGEFPDWIYKIHNWFSKRENLIWGAWFVGLILSILFYDD